MTWMKPIDETYIGEFLTFLAVKRNVAASTQNQALSAILFLYRVLSASMHGLKKVLGEAVRSASGVLGQIV